jgi:hypothetical protein
LIVDCRILSDSIFIVRIPPDMTTGSCFNDF